LGWQYLFALTAKPETHWYPEPDRVLRGGRETRGAFPNRFADMRQQMRPRPPKYVAAAIAVAAAGVTLGAGMLSASGAGGFALTGTMPQLGTGRIWSLAVAPATPTVVIAGTDKGLYVSGNSGVTWRQAFSGVRVWTVGFDARNPAIGLAGTDGKGIYTSSDTGATWANTATGLPNLDVRDLAFGLDGVAAATDGGVAVSPDGNAWHGAGLDGYDVSSVAIAANSPQFTIIAGADGGNVAAGYLFRSTGGSAWEVLQSGLPASAVISDVTAGPIDAAVPKRPLLAATSKGVYRSGDGGTTWTSAAGIPEALTLTTLLFSPLDPNLVYGGADAGASTGGDLFRSIDSGTTFAVFDQGLPSNSKNVAAVAVAQTQPPGVYAAIDPPGGGGVVFSASDTTAPAPPVLTPEAPGAPVPSAVATPIPTATPSPTPAPAPKPSTPGALQQFASSAFHWPTPLVYEIIFVLLVIYVAIRWRQRYYVEGPP
jgi:hypothetical protein